MMLDIDTINRKYSRELSPDEYKQLRISQIAQMRVDIKRLLGEVQRLRAAEEWISVNEKMPDDDRDVAILCAGGQICAAYYLPKYKIWMDSRGQLAPLFTHWRPLLATH